jgi:hypothetical protein
MVCLASRCVLGWTKGGPFRKFCRVRWTHPWSVFHIGSLKRTIDGPSDTFGGLFLRAVVRFSGWKGA